MLKKIWQNEFEIWDAYQKHLRLENCDVTPSIIEGG